MKRILIATLVALCVGATTAGAEDRVTALSYTISIPGSETEDYISETSWLGVTLDARQWADRDRPFMVGFSLGWHVLDYKTTETVQIQNGAVTGNQARYLNSFPLLITGHYYLKTSRDTAKPFIGVGVGTIYEIQTFEVGVYTFEESNWHFAVAPEVGVQFPLSNADGIISVRYNYAFSAGESLNGESQAWDYLAINVGLAWAHW